MCVSVSAVEGKARFADCDGCTVDPQPEQDLPDVARLKNDDAPSTGIDKRTPSDVSNDRVLGVHIGSVSRGLAKTPSAGGRS
jgi:hypothetical protein